jgi:hypothetical protein
MVSSGDLRYEVRVVGAVSESWASWLDDAQISHQDGTHTVLTGTVADEAALHGLLSQLYALGLHLISVRLLNDDPPPGSESERHPDDTHR